jgi:hypothetical protein
MAPLAMRVTHPAPPLAVQRYLCYPIRYPPHAPHQGHLCTHSPCSRFSRCACVEVGVTYLTRGKLSRGGEETTGYETELEGKG